MEKVYGYVLLPIAFTPWIGEDNDKSIERLWEAGEMDLTGDVEHFHEDGGFAPKFVEAGSEPEALEALARDQRS